MQQFFRCIADDLSLVYYATPKAACSSIRCAIGLDEHLDDRRDPNLISHYLAVTSVRNPWDRVVSLFSELQRIVQTGERHWKVNRLCENLGIAPAVGFSEFVSAIRCHPDEDSDLHYRSQHCFHPVVDVLVRFESLDDGWDIVRQWHPSIPKLGWSNRTDHCPFEEYYAADLVAQVGERYRVDIEKYGYTPPCLG